jgi:hypothetical protein
VIGTLVPDVCPSKSECFVVFFRDWLLALPLVPCRSILVEYNKMLSRFYVVISSHCITENPVAKPGAASADGDN